MTLSLRIESAEWRLHDSREQLRIKYAGFDKPEVLDTEALLWFRRSQGRLVHLNGDVGEALGEMTFRLTRHDKPKRIQGLTDDAKTRKLVRDFLRAIDAGEFEEKAVV